MAGWRQANEGDIPGILLVANEVHADLPEGDSVFEERLRLFPEGCLVLADGGDIFGYALSHPIRRGQPPALDSLLGLITPSADQFYIHDLAILRAWRGRGLAALCVERLLALGRRYTTTSLISVYNTGAFWGRFGFLPEPVDTALREKLLEYLRR
ncbi:hypothetical protein GGTG_13220 [Gaeumannomyces tritici R3-111a-1]|uniref:N-acetyltransferase domain-containing protein n=1 Tax=Gaeumannomyces tritici (strain R3-111a-1) TaxID=644352 RepID=J3PI92_GAET3|nr:hypothetical protein GGTG_13220 [Gaeumannomyces tritici R3-111a-1]EJT69604.1 hypothetical protein GGTG_13220 [Gaeumannomyces tritici R3-111a-1]